MERSFAEIWKTLSAVDLSSMVEKKMGLNYLSWASGWQVLMAHYPDAIFENLEAKTFDDGSVEVWVSVTIDGHRRVMWLPVMDHKNNAIKNPSSRQVSDARMRCLVKCLAMFGLGLYIYRGEDLPDAKKEENAEAKRKAEEERKQEEQEKIMSAAQCISQCINVESLEDVFKRVTRGADKHSPLYKAAVKAAKDRKQQLSEITND